MPKIEKAIEISDARIRFVSLVDKAANNKRFLITKADDGSAQFTTYGKIVKADAETHYVTGVVYEPLVEDTDGNFMTEEEIRKAAHWFAKHGDQVDIQHSFEAVDSVTVVETYVAPCDMQIGDELVTKGTWLMTVEIKDDDLWESIEKGEITGFSMGGVGKYGKEDIDLDDITKGTPEPPATKPAADTKDADIKKDKGFVKSLLSTLGIDFDVVDKGAVADTYEKNIKGNNFWEAFYSLQDVLSRWDWSVDSRVFVDDEEIVREALEDFSAIITNLLTEKSVAKTLSNAAATVEKAGKKISAANKKKLDEAYDILTELRESFADADEDDIEKEDTKKMNPDEIKKLVEDTVTEAIAKAQEGLAAKADDESVAEGLTVESVQKMINEAVEKATAQEDPAADGDADPAESITKESIQQMITETMEPLLKARGLPSNLNGVQEPIKKEEADTFDGFFI